jgi:antitoxin YokJ
VTADEFLEFAERTPGWQVLERGEEPGPAAAPRDLARFLERCAGVVTHAGVAVGSRVVPAQEAILGERRDKDRSAQWFVIAELDDSSTALRAVIDLDPRRLGRVYDGFWDRFGVAGSMPVIALSFTDLLERLVESSGEPYWADDDLDLDDGYG